MGTVSLWKYGILQPPAAVTTWLGSLLTKMEVDFLSSGVFVTLSVPPKRLLDWLDGTTGPVAIQHLSDCRMVIAVGDRIDAGMLRSEFAADLDFSVVTTSGSPERVRDFVKNIGRMDA